MKRINVVFIDGNTETLEKITDVCHLCGNYAGYESPYPVCDRCQAHTDNEDY